MYQYKATVIKVIDGDTVRLRIDLGFTVQWESSCRLYGINTPELHDKDPLIKAKALEAKQHLIDKLPVGTVVNISSVELDKYGRPLVVIFLGEEEVNKGILDLGLAVEYKP